MTVISSAEVEQDTELPDRGALHAYSTERPKAESSRFISTTSMDRSTCCSN